MKDLYLVLLQKEQEVQRVREEIEALRSVLPLLTDESPEAAKAEAPAGNKWPLEVTGSR